MTGRAVRLLRPLYVQILIGAVLGVLLGHFAPALGVEVKPLGDAFVKLLKMLAAPIIFTTVVVGIAKTEDIKSVGRIGLKALLYFEVATTAALLIGLLVGELIQPGAGMDVDPASLDAASVAGFTMGEARAVTSLIGNAVATVVVARWEGALDPAAARRALAGEEALIPRPVVPSSPAE